MNIVKDLTEVEQLKAQIADLKHELSTLNTAYSHTCGQRNKYYKIVENIVNEGSCDIEGLREILDGWSYE